MGVHGLTTYLRENQRHLSKSLTLPTDAQSPVDVVVDGWSFIYELDRDSGLPWVYGGEYDRFCTLVLYVVRAWVRLGLRLHFVFDGPYPQLKFPTLVSRLGQSSVQPSLLFFRTSSVSRSSPRFLSENRILPPLMYTACLHALKTAQKHMDTLTIHFADEEGDPYAVELAGRLGGYVVGNDSDFVILNTPGYRGYIPMTEMIWHSSAQEKADDPMEEDGEFTTVRKPKAKRKVRGQEDHFGVIPPDDESRTLSVTVYNPEMLAAHLKLPVSLLPLLGALIGNDFTTESKARKNGQSLFFEKSLTLPQRIDRVALTLQSIISPGSQKNKKLKHPIGSVMDLIDRAVNSLLSRVIGLIGSGEVTAIVDRTVEATLQYAIPRREDESKLWATDGCALHVQEDCPLTPIISRRIDKDGEVPGAGEADEDDEEMDSYSAVRDKYVQAYRKGHFSPKIMDVLSTATFWPRLFLENPDYETVSRSISRPIRTWMYSILHAAVGLPNPPPPEPIANSVEELEEKDEEDEDEDEDELIDVVESDSDDSVARDFLAPLKGELHRLQANETQEDSTAPSARTVVTEYIRRGTRVADEAIAILPLGDILSTTMPAKFAIDDPTPMPLRSQDERLHLFLVVLHSDLPSIRNLPPEELFIAVVMRWIIHTLHTRAQESESREKEKERWTKREVLCFLRTFHSEDTTPSAISPQADPPPMIDRHLQCSAQVLSIWEAVGHLAQTLLITEVVRPPIHNFSCKKFHEFLAGTRQLDVSNPLMALEQACLSDTGAKLSEERVKKSKKASKRKGVELTGKGEITKANDVARRGYFMLQMDMV